MERKKYYKAKDFIIANNHRAFFAFNDVSDYFIKNLDKLYDTEESESEFNLLDFSLDYIDKEFDKNFLEFVEESKKEEILYSNPIEKLSYLEEKIKNDPDFFNLLDKNGKLSLFNEITAKFSQFESSAEAIPFIVQGAKEFVLNYYKESNKDIFDKLKIIPLKVATDTKIQDTITAIKDGYELLLSPVFEYKKCLATPFYYDVKQKTIGILLYSSKSSLKDIVKAYFEVKVMREAGFEVENVKIIPMIKELRKNVKKNEIKFQFSEYANHAKSKASTKDEDFDDQDELNHIIHKNPNYDFSRRVLFKSKAKKIIEHINEELESILSFSESEEEQRPFICPFERFVRMANSPEDFPEINKLEEIITEDDLTCPVQLNDVYLRIMLDNLLPDYAIASKKAIKLKIANTWPQKFSDNIKPKILEFFDKNLIWINPSILKNKIYEAINEKDVKIVWFDFEGVTSTKPIIDFSPQWTQLICQNSIIKTINNNIIESESFDYVYDPQKYSYETLIKVIEDLYDEEAKYYVVFNESYEKSRIKEAFEILELNLQKYKNISQKKLEELRYKKDQIINNLVDIAKLFSGSKATFSDTIILIGAIKGRYSIKKIEHFVTENNLELEHKVFPYHELKVKNGGMALQIATARLLGAIKDNEWNSKVEDLKRYCHNDVLAMIMVADLVNYLMKNFDEYKENYDLYKG
ncbi:UU173 family protein [Metamycoplasma spumans]|uniref:UU173 family protein n=1 Tax=Metamycoplasma spumans TaxID=92406 RepID=UPI0034DCFEB6